MLGFWTVCAILILVALIIILPPLFAKEPKKGLDRGKINRAVYDNKLSELDRDLSDDLIDRKQYEVAKHDLQRTLIDDIAGQKEQALKKSGKVLPAIIILMVPAVAVFTYLRLDNGLILLSPDFQARLQVQQQGQMPSVEEAIAGLEEKLKQDPNNLDGWLMLGRSYSTLKRYEAAATAYAKANEITQGANPNVLVTYGEARGVANGQKFDRDSLQLFTKALRIDPGHEKGLWYAGLAAFQLKDYMSATDYWERLLQQMPADQEQVKSALKAYLNDARQKAGIKVFDMPQGNNQASQKQVEASEASIAVNVSLAVKLKEKVETTDTLFIYARAQHGPRMPLALVKMTVADLPVTVVLDDSVAMIPDMTLSSVKQVEVVARISKSGQAVMRSGDLYGSVHSVHVKNSETVNIVINNLAD